MKLSSIALLEAISEGDCDAVYDLICSHFHLQALDRIYVDVYPAIGISKYAILWQDGYTYSWNSAVGWEEPRVTDTPETELLIRT